MQLVDNKILGKEDGNTGQSQSPKKWLRMKTNFEIL